MSFGFHNRLDMDENIPQAIPETNYSRACDACRLHKVRCIPSSLGSSQSCQRCERADRPCVHTAPQKRKQRKRTDTRVAELEREVQAMRTLMERPKKKAKSDVGSQSEMGDSNLDLPNGDHLTSNGFLNPETFTSTLESSSHSDEKNMDLTPGQFLSKADVIERGILSLGQADFLFKAYNQDLVYHFPCVLFSAEVTARSLRRTKPILFLAVMAAASGKFSPRLYSVLYKEVITAYAHRTIIDGEKSLELAQAMLIICVWYNPPGKYALLKCYEYIHMALTMVIDLGLGTNPASSRSQRHNPPISAPSALSDSDIESRRTFLFCYIMSFSSSMTSKRPTLLRYNSWVAECVESFANVPNGPLHTKVMVAWVQLLKITEDIHTSLSLDDPGSTASLSESRVRLMVSGFSKTLEDWRKSVELIQRKDSLLMAYHHTQIYLHEISLHDDHPPEEFKPPFISHNFFSVQLDPVAKYPHIENTTACVSHTHLLFDVFLQMSSNELRAAPVLTFVRIMYAVVVLVKAYISSKSPESKIGAPLDPHTLKVGYYLDAIIKKMRDASGPMECRAPLTFLSLIAWLHDWYRGQVDDQIFSVPTSIAGDLVSCSIPPLSAQSKFADSLLNGQVLTMEYGPFSNALQLDLDDFLGYNTDLGQGFQSNDGLPVFDPGINDWNECLQDPTLMDIPSKFQGYDLGL